MSPGVPSSLPEVKGLRVPGLAPLALLAAIACLALAVSATTVKMPLLAVVGVGALGLAATLGMEAVIAVCLLGACGLLPFLEPNQFVAGDVKAYALLFLLGSGAMLVTYSTRVLTRKPRWPLPVNMLTIGLLALFAYICLVALASNPKEVPAMATPFFIVPASALVTLIWLSHEDALTGLRRALPLIVVIVAGWALAYDAGAAGCGPCRSWVGADLTNDGLLGPGSRLYTAGQNTFLGLFLACFAYALWRPDPLPIGLVALGAVTIALQASRAQYIAVAAGIVVLLIWKFGQLRPNGRLVLIVVAVLGVVALLNSPVGSRATSAFSELQQGSGTGTERIQRIEATKDNWIPLGQGFSNRTVELGYDIDLGLPNTLLVLGYLGAFLQLALLGLGIWRGVAARTLAGVTTAAILLMVLVARPTLPLLEYGHSAVFYGALLGFAAALVLAQPRSGDGRTKP